MTAHFVARLVVLALAAGCASRPHDVTAAYPKPPAPSGAIDVVLTTASSALSVTVNDALVVDGKHSRRARIEDVPPGPAWLRVVTGGGCEQAQHFEREVDVIPGQTVTVALPSGEVTTGCGVYYGLKRVGVQIGLVALAVLTLAL